MQPKSVAFLCGGKALHNADGFKSDKKVSNEEVAKIIGGEMWKKEETKKKK